MDISHNAFIGNNKENVVVNPDGKTFKTLSTESNKQSHCVYYPSFQGKSVRFGLRLSLSSQSRVLFGFVIYSIENEMFFFVLYDLYRNEFIINNNHYPISSLTEDYDSQCDCYMEWSGSTVSVCIQEQVTTVLYKLPLHCRISPMIQGSCFECTHLLCYEVDLASSLFCDSIPILNEGDFHFPTHPYILLQAKPRRNIMNLRKSFESPPSVITLPPRLFGYTGNQQLITVLSHITGNRLRISLPYSDSRRISLTITHIEKTQEIYVSGYGLKNVCNDKDWLEEWFEIRESSVIMNIGCIEGVTEDVNEMIKSFHGITIEGTVSSICIRLTHQITANHLSIMKEGECIYEEEIHSEKPLFPVFWYNTDMFMTVRVELSKQFISSFHCVQRWQLPSPSLTVPLMGTFLNNCIVDQNQFTAVRAPRIITSQYCFSHGVYILQVKVGPKGIKGIGICSRPVSETAPQDDLSVCYYDCKQGEMIGSLLCTKSLQKVHEGDIIEMKVDFSFGSLCFSVNQVLEWETFLTYDLTHMPKQLYACILVDEEKQSFEILKSELIEGRLLGNVRGGDIVLRKALNTLSNQFWKQQEEMIHSAFDIINLCMNKPLTSSSQLTLIGNGAICSAFKTSLNTNQDIILKRIHPYLFLNPEPSLLSSFYEENWTKPIETYEYDKGFFFDYAVSHDLPYRYFVQSYYLSRNLLSYSIDPETQASYDPSDSTLYHYCQPMSLSLKTYLDHSDNETGIGCYHALAILLRLSYCLNYLYQFEIVHNDLKLDNIMIVKEETPTDIRLIDFGESYVGFDIISTSPAIKKGNMHFKAPELSRNYKDERVIDSSKADVWSLGVLAYALVGKEANPDELKKGNLQLELLKDLPFVDRLKKFISNVLIVDENQRPYASDCIRLLMELLYNIPQHGMERINELYSKARELYLDPNAISDNSNALLCESIVCALGDYYSYVYSIKQSYL